MDDLVRNSLLYRHFQAQREEILKHKWYESEKAGHDIGFDRALTNWVIKHRAGWLRWWRAEAMPGRIRWSSDPRPGPAFALSDRRLS